MKVAIEPLNAYIWRVTCTQLKPYKYIEKYLNTAVSLLLLAVAVTIDLYLLGSCQKQDKYNKYPIEHL